MRFRDGLKRPHEIHLGGLFDGQLLGGQVQSLGVLLLGEVHVLQGLPPVVGVPHGQGTMVDVAVRFLASGLNAGRIDGVIIELDLPDDPLKLRAVDGGPAILLQGLAEFGVIVGVDVGLLCDSEQVGIPGLSGDGIEGGELGSRGALVHLDAEGFVDPFALGLLERLHSLAALVLLACLRQHNKIIRESGRIQSDIAGGCQKGEGKFLQNRGGMIGGWRQRDKEDTESWKFQCRF